MKCYFFLLKSKTSTTTFSNNLFANALKKRGYNITIVYDLDEKISILNDCDADIIFFQKTIQCSAHTSKYIKNLKGRVFLCHIDDDFLDMNSSEHINTLNVTDLILVGNESHKRALKSYTKTPVETINHLLDFENYDFLSPLDRKNSPLIISWQQAWADAYVNDLLSISDCINKLHAKYNFTLNLYGWHMGIDYRDLSLPIRREFPYANLIPYQPREGFNKNIIPQLRKSDIYICPYINIPDRIGKSAFGLKRIMLLGIPVIASNTEHHQTLINDTINGFLASSNFEWYNKLETLIKDEKIRYDFALKSKLNIDNNYNEEVSINKFINNIEKYFPQFTN